MIKTVGEYVMVETIYDGTVEGASELIVHDRDREYCGDFYGRVVSVGPDYKYPLAVGDVIRFRRHEGWKVEHEGVKYLVLKPRWIDATKEEVVILNGRTRGETDDFWDRFPLRVIHNPKRGTYVVDLFPHDVIKSKKRFDDLYEIFEPKNAG